MNRRAFLGVATLMVGAMGRAIDGRADEVPTSFVDWARALYFGDIALRDSGASLSGQELQSLFTPEIQALRDETRDRVPPPTEPEGPILDILLGWGALPDRKVEMVSIAATGADGATVDLTIAGNPSRLHLRGVFDPLQKTWRIDDIDYGDGGPDRTLRGRLARMKGWQPR